MEKFMLIFWNTSTNEDSFMEQSPEAMQAEMAKWNAWIGRIAAQGKLISSEALVPRARPFREKPRS